MGEFEPLNLDLNKERLVAKSKKRLKKDFGEGIGTNPFSVFIENALI